MGQVLLTDCDIIVDSYKSFEKASLHIVDDKIENVYFDKRKCEDIEKISLKGLTVLPDIFLESEEKTKLKELSCIRELYCEDSISTLIDDIFSDDYLLCDADSHDDKFLDFAIKTVDRDRLIILTEDPKKILKTAFDYNDALTYLLLNAYKALGYPSNKGKIMRGVKADFIIVDDTGDIKARYREGRLVK